jgi:hypothetical protein
LIEILFLFLGLCLIYTLDEYFQLEKKPNLAIGVNLKIDRLRKVSNWINNKYSISVINVNKDLSKLLIGKTEDALSRKIVDWFIAKKNETETRPIQFSGIEILFEPLLKIDPLKIFKQVSRNVVVLVLWPGEYRNDILSYASPEHAHYETWADPGVEIIQI